MERTVRIENIVFHPESIDTVSMWIYEEFVERQGTKSLEFVKRRFKQRNLDKLPISFIALANAECVGVISIFENDLETRKDLTPWLAGLYVEKKHRANGIAEKLITAVLRKCKELKYKKIYLRTEETAEYYRKRAWVLLGHTVDEYRKETSIFFRDIDG